MVKYYTLQTFRQNCWLLVLSAFIVICTIFGGSSRTDNPTMLVVRFISALYIIAALLIPQQRFWYGLKWPLLMIGAFAATIALQLIPLPPAVWAQLPGHQPFLSAATAAGAAQPWRPISLSPDSTMNSLVALLIPLATIIGTATLTPQVRRQIIPVLLLTMIISAVLGIVQWAGGESSPLYFYQYTSRDLPVGLFANRNHQAVFLAIGLPLLRLWAVLPSRLVPRDLLRAWLAASSAFLIMLVILATGSRSGFVLALAGGIAGFAIAPPSWKTLARPLISSRPRLLISGAVLCIVFAAAVGLYISGRAVSVTRLMQAGQVEADLRVRFFPVVLHMLKDFFPLGSGHGTFESLFHVYEPFWALKRTNYNHAHNDLIELILTGGLPSLLVLLSYSGYVLAKGYAVVAGDRMQSSVKVAAAALIMIFLLFAASLTDYPLRTPTMAMLFTFATCLLPLPQTNVMARRTRS